MNFRTEVCSKAKDPRLAMRWIKEFEMAQRIDDLWLPGQPDHYTGYEPKYNVDDDTEITPIIYPGTDDRKLDFSTDLISDGEQTKFGSRQAAASAASTSFDPSRVCENASTGEPVQREREKEREKKKQSLFCK